MLSVVPIVLVIGCDTSAKPADQSNQAPAPTCWNGAVATKGTCPDLEGSIAMQWLVPTRPQGPSPSCIRNSPTDYSPAAKSAEIMECKWPDKAKTTFYIERFSSATAAESGCHTTDDWTSGGSVYGRTGYTVHLDYAERWWCYRDSTLVFELTGPSAAVNTLSSELVFRTPEQARTGHL